MASRSYPELKKGNEDFLAKQLVNINNMQAEKDFTIAQVPGSAQAIPARRTSTMRSSNAVTQARRGRKRRKKRVVELEATALKSASHEQPPAGTAPEAGPVPRPILPGPYPGGTDMGGPPGPLPPGLDTSRGGAPR